MCEIQRGNMNTIICQVAIKWIRFLMFFNHCFCINAKTKCQWINKNKEYELLNLSENLTSRTAKSYAAPGFAAYFNQFGSWYSIVCFLCSVFWSIVFPFVLFILLTIRYNKAKDSQHKCQKKKRGKKTHKQ